MFEDQPFDPARHNRAAFTCGQPVLDDYLRRYAAQHAKKGVAAVRVLVDTAAPRTLLGYYTLSAAQVDATHLAPAAQKVLPRYPVPCFRLGRLAAHIDHQGLGLGRLLIGCAVERCLQARQQVTAYALLVDAKDARAHAFYVHYGFTPCQDDARTLHLPLGA